MIKNPSHEEFKEVQQSLSERVRRELNWIRTNPKQFQDAVEKRLQYYRDTLFFMIDRPNCAIRTVDGDKAPRQLIELLRQTEPLPAFEYSPQLQRAADNHARDLGQNGKYSHQGSNQKKLADRVASGQWPGYLVEVLECGYKEPRDILFSLLIDDGVPTRPNQKALLSRDLRYAGIAVHPHKQFEYITVIVLSDQSISKSPKKSEINHHRSIFSDKNKKSVITPKEPMEQGSLQDKNKRSSEIDVEDRKSRRPVQKNEPEVVHNDKGKQEKSNCILF